MKKDIKITSACDAFNAELEAAKSGRGKNRKRNFADRVVSGLQRILAKLARWEARDTERRLGRLAFEFNLSFADVVALHEAAGKNWRRTRIKAKQLSDPLHWTLAIPKESEGFEGFAAELENFSVEPSNAEKVRAQLEREKRDSLWLAATTAKLPFSPAEVKRAWSLCKKDRKKTRRVLDYCAESAISPTSEFITKFLK
tara:strand:- start:21989 stop:22585 length:597 start_codon:yes stop_codon:yes gene_type:complete